MQGTELILGRTFGITFEHGQDFFSELDQFCQEHKIKQGYIPMFIAGFSKVELVGACEKIDDLNAPVWSKVYLENVEVLGGGTIAFDEKNNKISPHIHVAVGLKPHSAMGHTSHLLSAKVQFLVEMVLVEIAKPNLKRVKNPNLYDIPFLSFG
jgi:predicted DNA-binding protein with PD1-like motif